MSRPVCKVEDNQVRPCPTLSNALEDARSRGKGLTVLQLTDMKTLKPTRSYVVIRSGDFKKDGLVLNFCPWCGTNISSHARSPEEPPELKVQT